MPPKQDINDENWIEKKKNQFSKNQVYQKTYHQKYRELNREKKEEDKRRVEMLIDENKKNKADIEKLKSYVGQLIKLSSRIQK